MTKSAGSRRHLASSPFTADPVPVIEQYAVGDHVSHDAHGVGRVIDVESAAVSVDFGAQTVRVTSPYAKMTKL
ncbi:hypothetical protein P5P86_19745 [Nocardioides sp. BP30]|uniref:CarD family transcriptional regulator n=1 Tax=Nocardioides sp. BP30 TaxID=3036374 RepID=UPI0024689133|nr:CarD family transcriptional regulator [Nocardioides sp. BP30]WGL52171.1 hypothetical protein P5P86_19745 [Nocardioides sp. BP30]